MNVKDTENTKENVQYDVWLIDGLTNKYYKNEITLEQCYKEISRIMKGV